MTAVWLGLAPGAYAQAEPLEPGREVRLFVRGVAAPFEGTLTSATPEALEVTLLDGSSFTIAPAQLELSQVLTTRRNVLRGAIVGGGVGLGVGVAWVITDDEIASPSGGPGGGYDFGTRFDV